MHEYSPFSTTCPGCGMRLAEGSRAREHRGRWMHPRCSRIAAGTHQGASSKKASAKKKKDVAAPRTRQAPLSAQDYERYMASKRWAARKRAYFSTHVKRCAVCDGNVKIHLHHMTYERLGCELDEDMVALCELHHAGAHEHHKVYGGTLKEATIRYIERLQQIYSGL